MLIYTCDSIQSSLRRSFGALGSRMTTYLGLKPEAIVTQLLRSQLQLVGPHQKESAMRWT